jgi:hypothetical protein
MYRNQTPNNLQNPSRQIIEQQPVEQFLKSTLDSTDHFLKEPLTPQSFQSLDFQLRGNKVNLPSHILIRNINDMPSLPTSEDMERVYGDNLDQMYSDHNVLITKILSEEEDLIEKHKEHVNEIINVEKQEMQLIADVDRSGSDVEEYVQNLDKLLLDKLGKILELRKNLMSFNCHLQMEKQLQAIY